MQQVTLSDHTADQINHAEQQRRAAYEARLATYQQALQQHQEAVEKRRQRRLDLWGEGRYLAAVGIAIANWWNNITTAAPLRPLMERASHSEHIWQIGNQGEALVAKYLQGRLSDDWTLFHGYHNPMGEIDQVLVGPGGLFTLEIKHLNGQVQVHGDSWSRDKYDKYGNLVETDLPIRDKKGRSPSEQVRQSTERLLGFLQKTLPEARACPIVILSHQRGTIGQVIEPTVTVARLHDDNLARFVLRDEDRLDTDTCTKLVELIHRDHKHHAERRGKSSPAKARGQRGRQRQSTRKAHTKSD